MQYRMFVALLLQVAVSVAAVGTEHTVELNKAAIRTIMEDSKRLVMKDRPGRFTFTAETDAPKDTRERTTWTAKDVESFTTEYPRINITLTTNRLNLLSVEVDFIDNTTMSAPDFRIYASYVDDAQHVRYLVQPSEVHPSMDHRRHAMPLASPFSLDALDNLKVVVLVFSRVVSTYRYDIDPEQMVAGTNQSISSGLLYELTPPFSTMRIMFLTRHDAREDIFSLWVTRRPPMPKCTIVATTGDEILFVEQVSTSSPWGVGLNNVLLGPTRRRYTAPIRLIAHFYERRRSRRADFSIPVVNDLLRDVQGGQVGAVIPTSVEGITLRPHLSHDGKSIGLVMTSPSPMANVLLQLRIDTTFVFLEEVSHPPPGEPFEWKRVFSTNSTLYEAFADASGSATGVVLFDWSKYDEDSEESLRQWIHTYGGDVRNVFFSKASLIGKRSNSSNVLRVRVPLNYGTSAAFVPYTVLLTSAVAENNPSVQDLKNDKERMEALEKACVGLGVPFESDVPLMLLSYYIMLGEPQPDTGMPWRPLYESLPLREPTSTPLFFTDAEKALFDFEPGFQHRYAQTLGVYRAEYATIAAHAPWLTAVSDDKANFPRKWTESDYIALRSQIVARARNMSGVITIIPALDSLAHSAQPNSYLNFDNANQGVHCITQRVLSAGEELTLDYGAFERSRLDFFFQFGILSRSSPDEALVKHTVNGREINVTLTMARASIDPLLQELRKDSEEQAQVRFTAIKILSDAKRKLGDEPSLGNEGEQSLRHNIIEECAKAHFDARKEILGAHVRWLSDI